MPSALDFPYDEMFSQEQNLCIEVNDAVMVSFGACQADEEGPFYWGYMRCGDPESQKRDEPAITEECKRLFSDPGDGMPWFQWEYVRRVTYDHCLNTTTVAWTANKLIEMGDALRARLLREQSTANGEPAMVPLS